jgi:hypothetical protein
MAAMTALEVAGATVRILESCHSLWLFDPSRMRFRRLPRDADLDVPCSDGDWIGYHSFDMDLVMGTFVVGLNPEGTRLLRAWVHDEPCRHCADVTAEFSVSALRAALSGPGQP